MTADQLQAIIAAEVEKAFAGRTPQEKQDFGRQLLQERQAKRLPDLSRKGSKWSAFVAACFAAGSTRKAEVFQAASEMYGEQHPVTLAIGISTAAGGGVLANDVIADDYLEILRPKSVFMSMEGIVEIDMDRGGVKLSGGSSGATASYAGESSATNATGITFREVNLTPKILKCIVPVSNQALAFVPSMARIIEQDSTDAMSYKMDQEFLYGDGQSGGPKGLYWWAPNGTPDHRFDATATPDLAKVTSDLSKAVGRLGTANLRLRNPHWVFPTRVENYLKSLRTGANSDGNYGFKDEMLGGTLEGHRYIASNVARNTSTSGAGTGGSNSEIYLIDAGHIVIASNPTVRVEMVPYGAYVNSAGTVTSGLANDESVFLTVMEHDIAPRHREAIVVIENAAWFNA